MDIERREAMQSLAAIAAMATMAFTGEAGAQIAATDLAAQPYAKLDGNEKPVRGGILRVAAPVYIGFMNPNRWPVNDWISMGLIHQKLLITDGTYRPTVPFVAESVVREGPTSALLMCSVPCGLLTSNSRPPQVNERGPGVTSAGLVIA